MRLDINSPNPFEQNICRFVQIYLDDELLPRCTVADEERGIVQIPESTIDNPNGVKELRGRVSIRPLGSTHA